MRIPAVLILLFFVSVPSMAGVRLSGGADISSAYLWRGERVCGLHLYPELALTTGNFTFMAYGYFPFDGLYAERDIEASYRIRNVSLHTACYFVYMSHEETQLMEAALCWTPSRLPFRLRWFTFFHGDDSSYCDAELYHGFGRFGTLTGNCGVSVGKGIVHCEIRYSVGFRVGPLDLPVSCAYMLNPYLGDRFVNISAGLRF